jgi:quinol-cytochrome oxidoreductase complex cytochrome b subunit
MLSVDQLSFLDLLYAVPVADLAMRVSGAELHRVSFADWSALGVILAVIVLSWIGLHKNRAAMATATIKRKPIGKIDFFSLRFVQFLIEVIIICLYFAMGLELKFPKPGLPAIPAAPEEWITGILLCIFFAYIVWDLIDIREAKNETTWRNEAEAGALVTLVFLLLSLGIYLTIRATYPRAGVIVSLANVGLLVFVWLYRVAQDKCGNTKTALS